MQMNIWEILGIEPTSEETMIKKAYLAKLPEHHPEEDPDGFLQLRHAMEEALKEARAMGSESEGGSVSSAGPMMGNEQIQELLKKAEGLYLDCSHRFSPNSWKTLSDLPVCQDLESQKEAGWALLGFLMDHTHIPHSCYQTLNQFFGWTDEEDDLYRHFPEGFVNYLFDRINSEDSFRYDRFELREGFDYDRFCNIYFDLRRALGERDREAADAALQDLESMGMDHPDLTLQKVRHKSMQAGCQKEAWELAKELYAKDGEHIPTRFWYIQTSLKYEDSNVDPDELGEMIASLLDHDSESPGFWQLLGDHLRRQGDISKALLAYQRAKSFSEGEWELLDRQIMETADELSHQMEEDPEFHDLWQFASVCWLAHRYDQVRQALEAYTPNEEQKMSWLFLMAGSSHELEDYQTAARYRQEIWDATLPQERAYSLYLDLAEDYEKIGNPQKAEDIYSQAEEAFPDDPEIFYRHANLLFNNRKYENAVSLCDKALGFGFHRDAFLLRLEILLELERYQEVREDAEDIIKKGFQSAQLLFFYAKALKELEAYQEAEQVLKTLYERTGGAGIVCQEYADLCYQADRSEEALEWVDKALAQNDTRTLHYRKAEYLHDLKRYEEELEQYRKLASVGVVDYYIDYRTGRALYSMKQYEEAARYLRLSVEKEARFGFAWDMLGDALQCQGKWDDAAWAYEEGWKLGHLQSIRDLCRLMKRTHQHDRAAAFLEQGLKQFPDDGSLLWIYATILKRQNKYEEAAHCLGRYMEVKPKQTSSAYREIALLWSDAKDYEKAEIYYQKAIDHEPETGRNWRSLGKYYANTRKMPETALPYLEKAVQLEPGSTYGWMLLGEVYETLGQPEKSVHCYETSLKNYMQELEDDPDDCCTIEGIADVLVHLGRLDEAEEMAHRAISLQNAVFTCSSQICYEGIEDLAKAEEKRGNLEKALEWMKQAGQYSLTDFYPKEIARLEKAIENAKTDSREE